MTRVHGRHALLAVAVAAGCVAVITTLAAAATKSDSEAIHACRLRSVGLLRIPSDGRCHRFEEPVSWSVKGTIGPAGPPGPPGATGPPGPPGPAASITLESLAGSACTTATGASATLDVQVAAEGVVTLRCLGRSTRRLVINEVDYDQPGADTGGFVELYNGSDGRTALEGLALVLVNGDGTEYGRERLSGTLQAGAHLAVAVDLQNGAPDGVALVETGTGTLLDALSYEGPITAATIAGRTYSLVEGTQLPDDVADSNTVAGALARHPDGRDTDDAARDWIFTTTPTPGAPNSPGS